MEAVSRRCADQQGSGSKRQLPERGGADRQMESQRSQYVQEGEELSAELQLVLAVHFNQLQDTKCI